MRDAHDIARLRRGSLRCRGRLLGPRSDGGIPSRDGPADRDQHGRDRLAADGAFDPASVGRHSARRSALLDDAGIGARGAAVRTCSASPGVRTRTTTSTFRSRCSRTSALPRPGRVTAIDTHWIWQDGQRLDQGAAADQGWLRSRYRRQPGLGIEIDMAKVEKAHDLYKTHGSRRARRRVAMQYLIPDWKFDPKRPCLVR